MTLGKVIKLRLLC